VFRNRSTHFVALSTIALSLAACGEDSPTAPSAGATVEDFVASAAISGAEGSLRMTEVPRPEGGAPSIAVSGPRWIVNGGTAMMSVVSPTPFETVYVAASAPISGLFQSVPGFFEVSLPSAVTSADLLIAFPQSLPRDEFQLYVTAADAAGNIGPVREVPFNALIVGTGDVQVTVAWDTDADVDLHVVDPAGDEIYWFNRQSVSGGQLDLDSNAACITDGVRNENITWAEGTAPLGTYTVRVDYWSSCEASRTTYTVLINSGGSSQIYSGSFTGSGDNGGHGSGVLIDTFTRTTGPVAAPIVARSDHPVGPTTK
jgi:hypothetical protein